MNDGMWWILHRVVQVSHSDTRWYTKWSLSCHVMWRCSLCVSRGSDLGDDFPSRCGSSGSSGSSFQGLGPNLQPAGLRLASHFLAVNSKPKRSETSTKLYKASSAVSNVSNISNISNISNHGWYESVMTNRMRWIAVLVTWLLPAKPAVLTRVPAQRRQNKWAQAASMAPESECSVIKSWQNVITCDNMW